MLANNNGFVLPYEPLTHDLIGSPADRRRHIIARAALLNELRFDVKLNDVFHAVSEEAGLHALRQTAIEAKNDLAFVAGVDPDLVLRTKEWPKVETTKQGEVLKAGSRFLKTLNDLESGIETGAPTVSRRLLRLTRDGWNLSFTWLPLALIEIFVSGEIGFVLGTAWRTTYSLPSGETKEAIVIPAGTPVVTAIAHLRSHIDLLRRESSKRRFKEPDEQIIQRNVQWFYRRKIKGESVISLAREYHKLAHPTKARCTGDRSTVQSGIKEIDRILGLTPFHLPASPAENSR